MLHRLYCKAILDERSRLQVSNENDKLAAIYVNEQPYESLYSLPEGLAFGTIFPNLNMPYGKLSK